MPEAIAIGAVGLLVGAASTLTGLGAGLALPLLALLGLPLPAALLAVKLPVAVSDASAAIGQGAGDAGPGPGRALWAAACAGAGAALALLWLAPEMALALALVLALLAWVFGRSHAAPAAQAGLWGAYVGACGIGTGALLRGVALRDGRGWPGMQWHARRLGAAANLGAVAVLAIGGAAVTPMVAWLALTQGLGAWCMAALCARRRRLASAGPSACPKAHPKAHPSARTTPLWTTIGH